MTLQSVRNRTSVTPSLTRWSMSASSALSEVLRDSSAAIDVRKLLSVEIWSYSYCLSLFSPRRARRLRFAAPLRFRYFRVLPLKAAWPSRRGIRT